VGWLDGDGYLYISDRRTDMIKTGGVNVFPAEVEAALVSMPGIIDAAVIGLPDPNWSRVLHAIVVPVDPANPPAELTIRAFLRERLTALKIPKTFEFISTLGRAETMKLNRRSLAEERSG
jgi:bile acid-coenzyme A ligase